MSELNDIIIDKIINVHEKMNSYTDAEYRANFLSEIMLILCAL